MKSTCTICNRSYEFYEVRAGVCQNCEGKQVALVKAADEKRFNECLSGMILTTEMSPQLSIEKRLGIVGSQCALGMNIFKDIFVGGRDLWGGRSDTLQQQIQQGRETVLNELAYNGAKLDADAIIAISLTFSEFSGSGSKMLFIAGTGTAVKLGIDK